MELAITPALLILISLLPARAREDELGSDGSEAAPHERTPIGSPEPATGA